MTRRCYKIRAMRIEWEIALEFFCWGLETFSRRDCGLILAGYRDLPSGRELDRLLERWRSQQLIQQDGRGRTAQFTITEAGKKRTLACHPAAHWDTPWDGKWRVFSFDLPESRRKDRVQLWRHLCAAKFGFLQRSVWVWPHDAEATLRQIVQAQGIPCCFCGFECSRLFLCDHGEIVATAWDFAEIGQRHRRYLQHDIASPAALKQSRDLSALARLARVERDAYHHAFALDPLLPRSLWPKPYAGPAVDDLHRAFLAGLRRRLAELSHG